MRLLRVEEIVHQFDIPELAGDGNARIGEHIHLILDVKAEFGDGRILEDGLELRRGGFRGDAAELALGRDGHFGDRGEDARSGRVHDEGATARGTDGGRNLHHGGLFHFQLGGFGES